MIGHDGKYCPGCERDFLSAQGSLFNAMNRVDMGDTRQMMEKLWDMLIFHPTLPEPSRPHPAFERFKAAHAKLMEAMQGVVIEGSTMRWVPGTPVAIERVMRQDMQPVLVELDELCDAHREDARHALGEMNVLRARSGAHHNLWGHRGDTSYNYFVRAVTLDEAADIRHTSCGQRYVIADHFKDRLVADPTWYGKFDCRACASYGVPFGEVELLEPFRGEVHGAG